MSFAKDVAAGAAGGLAGGLVMTAFMTAASRVGLIDTPLPVRVERWAEDRMGIEERLEGLEEETLAQGGHLLFAAALGAAYGAASSAFRLPPVPSGPLYGAALYALDLGVLGPASSTTKGPWNEPVTTAGRRLMMHVVFGTVTALVADRVRR
jgi:hypothetical protein